jgi:hypothetical protein
MSAKFNQLPLATRNMLALSLATLLIGYCALFVAAYFQLTPPSSLFPNLQELDRLLLDNAKPVSQIERLLASTAGPMTSGGTMRPAFTDQSVGWGTSISGLSADEKSRLLADREGERLALLDWIRSGGSRGAYESDNYVWKGAALAHPITSTYCFDDPSAGVSPATPHIRIRSIITDRCVTCHSENGRHDIARFIPLDSYEQLQPRLKAEALDRRRIWLRAPLYALPPLAFMIGIAFWNTDYPSPTRLFFLLLTTTALSLMFAIWRHAQPNTWHAPVIAITAAISTLGTTAQALATLSKLYSKKDRNSVRSAARRAATPG